MTILIQDTARNNLATWGTRAVQAGYARGIVISPFASPVSGNGYKSDISQVASRIAKVGGEVWFDPTTQALQMPQVGDFRYYTQWALWAGTSGDLQTDAQMTDHVRRVFAVQNSLGARLLAPTILLHSAQSATSRRAADLAAVAVREAGERPVYLSISGDTHFWSALSELDAHIGLLDQLAPAGWVLSVARTHPTMPTILSGDEIAGLMRTVLSLSQEAEVIISHGDLAAVPALAAGASTVGTGWDLRQRVLAYSDYAARSDDGGGGQWYQRPTLQELLGNILPNEYQVLVDQQPALANALTVGALAAGPESAFRHHAEVLTRIAGDLSGRTLPDAVQRLRDMYQTASANWPNVQAITGTTAGAAQWVHELSTGVALFAQAEGL